MGLFDELSKQLEPHSKRLNETLALHGANIAAKLDRISAAQSDLARPDIGDKWHRIRFQKECEAEAPVALAMPPINQMYSIQSLVVDGIFHKSPAFIIEVNGVMIASVIKEGVGSENFGGDAVILPGEQANIIARVTGFISATLNVIRVEYPALPLQAQLGASADEIEPTNTHDPARDVITSRTGRYTEPPAELQDTGRRNIPAVHDPVVDPLGV